MRRRQALQLAAAAVTLPLTGCASAPSNFNSTTAKTEPLVPSPNPAPSAAPTATPTAPSAENNPPKPEPTDEAKPPEPPPEPPPPSFARVIARLGKNHGHAFVVTMADVAAGVEKTYVITGKSTHKHEITLSADDMKVLLTGKRIRKESTQGLTHKHRATIQCAPAEDPPEWVTAVNAEFSGQDEHEAIIPAADLAAGTDKTYDVQGLAGHNHTLTITASDFQKLKKDGGISIRTSRLEEDAHNHVVVIRLPRQKGKA